MNYRERERQKVKLTQKDRCLLDSELRNDRKEVVILFVQCKRSYGRAQNFLFPSNVLQTRHYDLEFIQIDVFFTCFALWYRSKFENDFFLRASTITAGLVEEFSEIVDCNSNHWKMTRKKKKQCRTCLLWLIDDDRNVRISL